MLSYSHTYTHTYLEGVGWGGEGGVRCQCLSDFTCVALCCVCTLAWQCLRRLRALASNLSRSAAYLISIAVVHAAIYCIHVSVRKKEWSSEMGESVELSKFCFYIYTQIRNEHNFGYTVCFDREKKAGALGDTWVFDEAGDIAMFIKVVIYILYIYLSFSFLIVWPVVWYSGACCARLHPWAVFCNMYLKKKAVKSHCCIILCLRITLMAIISVLQVLTGMVTSSVHWRGLYNISLQKINK